MRSFVNKHNYSLLLILIFIISELLVNPVGNFPLNDDWTYSKSVLILKNEGKFDIGNFAAMTLFSHLIWGFAFVKVFGFSFTVLRFSTLLSSLIGILILNKLLVSFTQNRLIGFIASLVLLFNPLYLNLSNTYMTDVNFNTLLMLSCYFAFDFFRTKSKVSFALVFIMSALLVLIRQFGILVPVCFLFSCLFITERRWLFVGFAALMTACIYLLFKYYEDYLKTILQPYASYKFSGNVDFKDGNFWKLFLFNLDQRYKQILVHLFVYTFPFLLIFSQNILRTQKTVITISIGLICFAGAYFFFRSVQFPFMNVFTNMSLGAETFYETLSDPNRISYTYTPDFANCMAVVKYVFCGGSMALLILWFVDAWRSGEKIKRVRPEFAFLLSFFFAYVFLILITESYFDRYHLPLISVLLILFSYLSLKYVINHRYVIPFLIGMFYVAVFGTKDYLEVNRVRWEAYNYLKSEEHVPAEKINGGFEVNCWNEGQYTWWSDFLHLDNFDYLIQYRSEPGFRLYKSFSFRRYFPVEKDKINVFIKETKGKQ